MVENDNNRGEYKVFHLTSTIDADTDDTDGEFDTDAVELGTLDFGDSINFRLVGDEDWASDFVGWHAAADGVDPGDPGDDLTEVDITDGSDEDAAGDDFQFNAPLGATDIFSANIANFSAGDVINIDAEYLGAENMLFATTGTTEINFAFGDMDDFTPSFTLNLTDVDADLVEDVDAAADTAAVLGVLEAEWGANWVIGDGEFVDDDDDDLTEVDITDGSDEDAAGDDFQYNAPLEATDIFSANIANFSAGDVINIDDAYLGADNMIFATTGTTEINFAFGDMDDFTPSFTLNLTDVDADLVADVDAAADTAAVLGILEAEWGADWLI